ncbi:single-stranded-DNA-specific exonuclease RecJ [Candidatus Kaiserbacteria bacterium]|nr:single-stranded-DNA-specific exonuclease RecJ [Candidatus Kaiserbacteria bacterium]
MNAPISELVRTLLVRRGVVEDADIVAFLSPDYEAHTHAPEFLNDISIATDRILKAMERGERIAIYADFDCDGIPGASILSDFFAKIKYENVEVYLPHRDREGYGFHTNAISALSQRGVKVIITVDVGTVAIEGCAHAHGLGIDVIVTDHHEIIGARPACLALVNPKIAPYPFGGLCGAGVAFKLVQATLREGKKRELENFTAVALGWEKWLLDLVAIATVADMVPLIGENRVLAHWGLKVLRRSARPGIDALCAATRIRKSELTEDDIGFSIAPRVNAASRMDEPDLALKLLTTKDRDEAERLAAQLEHLNASRKGVVAGIVKNARKHVAARYNAKNRVVVLGDPDWKPALLGLAANSIMNDRGGVVCLWGRDANGKLKGSCRSDGDISLADLFTHAREAFEECGGHAASGGFSVSQEQVHALPETLARAVSQLQTDTVPAIKEVAAHDALITLREISWPLHRDISLLSPFGMGNTKPVFRISTVQVVSVRTFGKEGNHVEIQLTSDGVGAPVRAFQFFKTAEDFTHQPKAGDIVHVLATLERDTFRGPVKLVLRVIDIFAA